MTINQVQLANTFNVWRIRTNQLIDIANDLKEGNLFSSGTITFDNSSGFQNNVTLNVLSGMIAADGGMLSNVGKPGSVTNQKLQNSSITVSTSQNQVTLSQGTIKLGDTVNLIVANLTTSNADTSTSNIASANLVNAVHKIVTGAATSVASAYNKANSANIMAFNSYEQANTANTAAYSAISTLVGYGITISQINANGVAAFAQANVANVVSIAAFAYANTRYSANGGTINGNMRVDGNATVNGSMNITGSLIVTGNTYFVDSITLNIADPLIYLASNNYLSDTADIGFVGKYMNSTSAIVYTGMFRNASSKEYYVFENYIGDPMFNDISTTGNNFTLSTLNTNIKANSVAINNLNVQTWITSAYAKANNVSAGGVPASKIGASGDVPGKIAFSNTHVYFSMNTYNGTANVWQSVPLREFNEPTPYLLMPYYYGNAAADVKVFLNAAPFAFYLPTDLAGSLIVANQAPSTAMYLTITKNGSSIGTINFAGGGGTAQVATVSLTGPVSFARGDILGITTSPTSDGTIGYIMFSILGYRI